MYNESHEFGYRRNLGKQDNSVLNVKEEETNVNNNENKDIGEE